MAPDGNSKEFGFVQFESVQSAQEAIKKMDGQVLGSKLKVSIFKTKDQRDAEKKQKKPEEEKQSQPLGLLDQIM